MIGSRKKTLKCSSLVEDINENTAFVWWLDRIKNHLTMILTCAQISWQQRGPGPGHSALEEDSVDAEYGGQTVCERSMRSLIGSHTTGPATLM
jgi:hypothetical protein